ncbi:MAG: S1 RNA-binding domain-containing protein [Patulibacter sp.]
MPEVTPKTAVLVGTDTHVATLAQEIRDPQRTRPVVVVTAKPSAGRPFVDADALAERLGELAAVWLLDDPDLTWTLTDALPPKLDVYGGAVRAYNTLDGDDPYPSDHPQWTVFNDEEGVRAVELIAGYVELISRSPLPAFGEVTTATVTTVRKAGAELDLATGHPAFVSIDHLIQHGEVFHAADVVQVGQQVPVRVGAWNPHAGRLSVTMREFAPDPWERLAEVYEPGMLIEGGVTGVTKFGAFVELLPGVEGLLHKSKISNEFVEYVDDYVREGDRLTVRLLDLDPDARKASVGLRDVPAGATAVPPASILPGGPPWLPMPSEQADPAAEPAEPAADGVQGDEGDAPVYLPQLQRLVTLIAEHGGGDGALAEPLREALERGVASFDARLDEGDDGSEDPGEPLVQLRDAAADLIDALRSTGE